MRFGAAAMIALVSCGMSVPDVGHRDVKPDIMPIGMRNLGAHRGGRNLAAIDEYARRRRRRKRGRP